MFRIRRSCEEHVTINAKGACGETGGPSITLGTWYSPPPAGPALACLIPSDTHPFVRRDVSNNSELKDSTAGWSPRTMSGCGGSSHDWRDKVWRNCVYTTVLVSLRAEERDQPAVLPGGAAGGAVD